MCIGFQVSTSSVSSVSSWKEKVRERDNRKCVICGRGGGVQVCHIVDKECEDRLPDGIYKHHPSNLICMCSTLNRLYDEEHAFRLVANHEEGYAEFVVESKEAMDLHFSFDHKKIFFPDNSECPSVSLTLIEIKDGIALEELGRRDFKYRCETCSVGYARRRKHVCSVKEQ